MLKKIINFFKIFFIFLMVFNFFIFTPGSVSLVLFDIDLTTFTEVDTDGVFTINNASRITGTNVQYKQNDYVYKDYGANYFQYYNFSFEIKITSSETSSGLGFWMLSNNLGAMYDQQINYYNKTLLQFSRSAAGERYIYLVSETGSAAVAIAEGVSYYIKIKNNGSATNKTDLSCYIYTDENHNTLYSFLNVTMNATRYRYLYTGISQHYGSTTKLMSGYGQNYSYSMETNNTISISINDATNVLVNSATLSGNHSNGGNSSCYFRYGLSNSYGINTTSEFYDNDTVFYKDIIGLTAGTVYHTSIYVNNTIDYGISPDNSFLTKPEAPTYTNITFINLTTISLNWTKGTGANNTVVIKKTTSIPTSITDGTVIYNNTGLSTTQTITLSESVYYRAWSYTTWSDPNLFQYSDNSTNFTIGGLYINCYDEKTLANLTFNISISNSDGSEVYNNWNCINTKFINASLCPQGLINILISSNGYENRVYYLTIEQNIFYCLNTYLPNITETIQLCRIDIVGPQTEYGANPPIENAYAEIKKYDNNTGTYESITSFYSDANGQYFIYLVVDSQYLINITHADYETEISIFIVQPDVVVYTFRLTPSTTIVIPSYDLFGVNISFICIMLDGGGYNQMGNITIAYSDVNLSTIDTDIYLYSYLNDTLTFINTWHNTTDTVSLTVGNINTTRTHIVSLYYNNTASFSDMSPPFIVHINPVNIWSEYARFDINERITNIVGPMVINGNVISWADVLAIIPAIIVLVLLGPFNTGVAIIGSGLALGLSNVVFAMWFTNAFPTLLVTAMPIIVVVGVLYIMAKQGGDNL